MIRALWSSRLGLMRRRGESAPDVRPAECAAGHDFGTLGAPGEVCQGRAALTPRGPARITPVVPTDDSEPKGGQHACDLAAPPALEVGPAAVRARLLQRAQRQDPRRGRLPG